jgi:cobalt-zinc-cadmium efflux system protein
MSHHHHHHGPVDYGRAFAWGVALNTAYIVVEATFGILSGSLALLADAGHNLSDALGLLLAWGGTLLARRGPTVRRTYGLQRSTILAALGNAMLLLAAVGAIAWEAVRRLFTPEPPPGAAMVWVAAVGIVVNAATAMLFFRGRHDDVNVRGAFLHMAADAAVSAGVVVAGIVVERTGWAWLDPAVSLLIVVVIFISTWDLLRESLDLALDAVPKGIDPAGVYDFLAAQPGVTAVHDLHIWGLSTTDAALTAHLVVPSGKLDDARLAAICRELHDRYRIEHSTLQVERGDDGCPAGTECGAVATTAVRPVDD